jgi:hypothetical protein
MVSSVAAEVEIDHRAVVRLDDALKVGLEGPIVALSGVIRAEPSSADSTFASAFG